MTVIYKRSIPIAGGTSYRQSIHRYEKPYGLSQLAATVLGRDLGFRFVRRTNNT